MNLYNCCVKYKYSKILYKICKIKLNGLKKLKFLDFSILEGDLEIKKNGRSIMIIIFIYIKIIIT
jgi:hypothetical protein